MLKKRMTVILIFIILLNLRDFLYVKKGLNFQVICNMLYVIKKLKCQLQTC